MVYWFCVILLLHFLLISYFPYFEKMKGGSWNHLAVSPSVYPFVSVHLSVYPPLILLCLWDHLTVCPHPQYFRFLRGPYLSRRLMRSPCCVCVCVSPNIFVFCAVRVISKGSRRLAFSIPSYFQYHNASSTIRIMLKLQPYYCISELIYTECNNC
jgi:hypothetical protein